MPDLREIMLLMPTNGGVSRLSQLFTSGKHLLRRFVVVTAGSPLSHLYRAIYHLHVWYGVRVARKFPGTRAIYLTRSMASGDITIGVSDIDILVVGDWPEEEHIRLMKSMGVLGAVSPLYDPTLWQQVFQSEQLRHLSETDYFFQSRFDEGRTKWKLVYGEDVTTSLKPIPPERLGGVYYMEIRVWWLHFITSIFGSGPTARDTIFRNSISYKVVAEMSRISQALQTGVLTPSRPSALNLASQDATPEQRGFLDRLRQSALTRHLRFDGDIADESFRFLLPLIDRMHARLLNLPAFEPIADFHVDADPSEILRTPADLAHAHRLVEHVKAKWPGYRASYLLPSVLFFRLDDMMLLIEADPERLPTVAQVRELCKVHAEGGISLHKRISPYLLLPHGACQLQLISAHEMWRLVVFPPDTPDVFTLIERPEFRIDGSSQTKFPAPCWSRFASDLRTQEADVRRSVAAKVTPDMFPSSIEIIRNVYRHLQLEILLRSSAQGRAIFALSPAAIERHLPCTGVSGGVLLGSLREAYMSEMRGETSNVRPLVPELLTLLKQFC